MRYKYSLQKEFSKNISLLNNVDFSVISVHSYLSFDFVDKDLQSSNPKPWNWKWLSQNQNLTFDFILKYRDKEWDWFKISGNSSITMKSIRDNSELPWCYKGLSFNPNLTLEFFEEKLREGILYEWNWLALSERKCFTLDYIEKHKDLPWNFNTMMMNPNISIEMIRERKDIPWDMIRFPCKLAMELAEREQSFERTIQRTRTIFEDLMAVTGQPEYYFIYCLDKEDLEKEFQLDEEFLKALGKPNLKIRFHS
jgi:hypothetical protein